MSLLERTLKTIYPQDSAAREAAKNRLDNLAIPHWALGDLMDLAIDIAGITKTIKPQITKKAIVTMAGDHGVVAENISKYPSEVTPPDGAQFCQWRGWHQCTCRSSRG